MITKIVAFLSALLLTGCCLAKADALPITFQNDTDHTFTSHVNDGNMKLANIGAHGGQNYTWATLKKACSAGACEMMINFIDSNEVMYIVIDPVKQQIDEWAQVGGSDVCIQEKNNVFHLFPGCAL